jgi:hypothetical protein
VAAGSFSQDYVCDECGMVYGDHGPAEVVDAVRAISPRWRELVTGVEDDLLRQRPDPDTWSAIEYGWHLGSGLDWMADAIDATVAGTDGEIAWFGHEQDVREADPRARDRDEVTTRLDQATSRLAVVLARIDDDGWERTARFPWGERDVLDTARNAVHEGVHHLDDVRRVLGRVR